MQDEILFSGFGGQGVMFIGQLLAYAALEAGYEVTWIPSYGPEMRGGTAHCYVVISDKPIGSPVVSHPKVAVAFNKPSFEKYESVIAPDGLLVYNSSLIQESHTRFDIQYLPVPATEIADQLGNTRLTNIVMLGALLTVRPILSIETLQKTLGEHIPPHRRDLLPLNLKALEKGITTVNELHSV